MKNGFKSRLVAVCITTVALLSFSVLGCVTPAIPEAAPEPNSPPVTPLPTETENTAPQDTEETAQPTDSIRVNIVYFHRTNRCHSCQYAEAQTIDTLKNHFADEINNGIITFISVDVQDAQNSAIIEKYGAYASQLFITTVSGDTEHTEEVIEFWNFIDNDEGFSLLIISKLTDALKGTE